jgi:uncharacterized membrane protein YfcA
MKIRWILAGCLGVAALAGAYMAVITWHDPAGGPWVFLAFTALLAVLAYATARPSKPPKEEASTRFVPAWFFDGALLLAALLILAGIVSCIFGR